MQKQNDLITDLTIQQMFDNYCDWRLSEAKNKKEYDYCIEQFAKTEFFKIGELPDNIDIPNDVVKDFTGRLRMLDYDDFSLPFERQFIDLSGLLERSYLFIGEYSPKVLTGSLILLLDNKELKLTLYQCTAFTLTEEGYLHIQFQETADRSEKKQITVILTNALKVIGSIFSKLNRHLIVEDKPTGVVKYYRRKLAPTIKVENRPIYYVLDKKYKNTESYRFVIKHPIGKLSPTHAFKVRGFWRTFEGKQLGKNRNGERVVEGYTWVKEHIRGYGELKKKLRVIK